MKKLNKAICSVIAVIGIMTGSTVYDATTATEPVGDVVIENQHVASLRVSPAGLRIIGNAEGCRLEPYTCPAGLPTNGIGNTHDVKREAISLEQVAKDWAANIKDAERCIENAEEKSGQTLTQGQFDAFVSFSFNTGCTRFMRNRDGSRTQIYTKIIRGEFDAACNELPRWVYGGGKRLNGLVIRRGKEHARCFASN